jgi:DNA-binding NarL/FixJ family response regulator
MEAIVVATEQIIKEKQNWITPHELRIVEMMADGWSSKEIADKMGNALKTIEVHRHNILKKTKCKNTAHLVATFFRQNLIK